MRKKALYIITLMLLLGFQSFSQEKGNFELAERFTSEKMKKMTGSLQVQPQWIEDKNHFWYQYENGEGTNWYFVDADKRSKRKLFDQEQMAELLTLKLNRTIHAQKLPIKNLKYDDDASIFKFEVDSFHFTYKMGSNDITMVDTSSAKTPRWMKFSPDSNWIAFAKNHNLYVMKNGDKDSVEIQLTTDGERWFSYASDQGDTSTTKRVATRAKWFKDSKKLYLVKQDNRKVEELWVIKSVGKKRPSLQTYKYAMPGEKNISQHHLVTIDVSHKQQVNLDVEKWKDQSIGGAYFGNSGGIFTTEKSDYIYFLRRNRMWNKIDVCKGNTTTGEVQVLWSEESNPYFNTRYANLGIINEGEEFIWHSERTGWGQLYLYDKNGQLKNKITTGHFVVGDIVHLDTNNRTIYFGTFGKEENIHPYYAQYYKTQLDGGSPIVPLTPEDATHTFYGSDKDPYFVDNYSRVNMAPKSVLRDKSGQIIMNLEETNIDRMVEQGWKMPEIIKVKATDGVTDIYGVMFKPFDFDSTKQYPIITYVYPGPQTEPFPINFSISSRTIGLAQVGFIVVAVGNRGGNPKRSKYYHNFGYGNLRDYPLADNKYALEQLAGKHPFIDINRVGIFGHSGGGFMSTAAILTYPNFYKVAVSSAGNHDNNIYNIFWGEVHHGVEEKKSKGKKKDENPADSTYFSSKIATNQALASRLKGKLLLVHGDEDNNVHPANSTRVADALIKANKRFDYMVMPGQRHGFGKYNDYFERMKWYYFAEHLLGDYRTNVDIKAPNN